MDLEYLIGYSGDSVLETYSYSNGVLELALSPYELGGSVNITIKTMLLSFDKHILRPESDMFRICRIELEDISSVLSTKNGFYIPKSSFEDVMHETRRNYSLAYGKRPGDARYMFSLVGYGRLVSCLVADLHHITVRVL